MPIASPDEQDEDAAGRWHAGADDMPLPSERPAPPAPSVRWLLIPLIALVCAVLTTGTAATVYVAAGPSWRSAESERAADPRGDVVALAGLAEHRRVGVLRALADSLVAPLGTLAPLDSAGLRYVMSVLRSRSGPNIWIDTPEDSAATARVDTLTLLRTWARSAPLPAFWGIRQRFGGVPTAYGLPVRAFMAMRRLVDANEQAADSALLAGDAATAMTRARETIAGARHLATQPFLLDVVVGNFMLRRGALLLARAARQGDEPYTASAALRLAAMSGPVLVPPRGEELALQALARDPADGRIEAIAKDTTMHLAWRLLALERVVSGACLNPREVLFGVSSARRAALDRAAASMEDMPRAFEVLPLYRALADAFDGGPGYLQWERRTTPMISHFVPTVVWHRVQYCRTVR